METYFVTAQADPSGDELVLFLSCVVVFADDWVPRSSLALTAKSMLSCLFVTQSCSFSSVFFGGDGGWVGVGLHLRLLLFCPPKPRPDRICVLSLPPRHPKAPSDAWRSDESLLKRVVLTV